jgi:hypothetical protein
MRGLAANNMHRSLSLPLRHHPGLQRRRRSPIRRQWWTRRTNGALRNGPDRTTSRSRGNRTIPGGRQSRWNVHIIGARRQHYHHIRNRALSPWPESYIFHLQLLRHSEQHLAPCHPRVLEPGCPPLPNRARAQDRQRH